MANATFDLDSINAELESMSEEDLRKTLLDMKVKQKVATGKYYNPEAAKVQRQKAAAKQKALIQLAKDRGLYDEINAAAKAKADEVLANFEAEKKGAVDDADED